METYCHVKFDAFRRLGLGEYVYSRVLLRALPSDKWTATIWLKHPSHSRDIAHNEGTAVVIDRDECRNQFHNSEVLIRYLIETMGYTFLFNNLEESR